MERERLEGTTSGVRARPGPSSPDSRVARELAWFFASARHLPAPAAQRGPVLSAIIGGLFVMFLGAAALSAATRVKPIGWPEVAVGGYLSICTMLALALGRFHRVRAGATLLTSTGLSGALFTALTEDDLTRALASIAFVLSGVVYAAMALSAKATLRAGLVATAATLALPMLHSGVAFSDIVLTGFLIILVAAQIVAGAYLREQQVAKIEERARALRVSEARLRAAFDGSPDAVVAVDAHTEIIAWSRQAELVLGWSESEVLGRPLLSVIGAGDESAPLASRLTSRPDEAGGQCECTVRDRAGRVFPVEVSTAAMDLDGRPGISLFLRDVAESRRLKADLIQRDRIVTVGRLAAGVAHEINNPLSAVFTNLEVARATLEREGDGSELDPVLADALDGARRVRDIVADLRSFARASTEPEGPVDVREALDSALQLGAGDWRRRAVLESSHGPLPNVHASKGRLVRVFVSLIANAAQSKRGGGPVAIRITSRAHGGTVELRIADEGDGIPAEIQDRIFAPFFTTRDVGDGSGLGLYVARNTLRALGGDLVLESSSAAGSVFLVTLRAVSTAPTAGPRHASTSSAVPHRRLQVLIVDDDRSVAEAIGRCFPDHAVTLAGGAEEALACAGRKSFDLVLADVRMPGMSGAELAEHLVRDVGLEPERIMLMTGGTLHDHEAAAVARWGRRCLEKPLRLDDLLAVVAGVAPRPTSSAA